MALISTWSTERVGPSTRTLSIVLGAHEGDALLARELPRCESGRSGVSWCLPKERLDRGLCEVNVPRRDRHRDGERGVADPVALCDEGVAEPPDLQLLVRVDREEADAGGALLREVDDRRVRSARGPVDVEVQPRAEELDRWQMRLRIAAAFWPIPPVKTTASTPPITAA